MARRLHFRRITMQIPYDLEFVENRPRVAVRAAALHQSLPGSRRPKEQDVFDVLLAWVHRLLRRFDKS